MKKIFILLMTISLCSLMLTGCFSKSEREKIIEQAIAANAQGDYENTFKLLRTAESLGSFSQEESNLESMLGEAGNKVYKGFLDAGVSEFEKKNFESALEQYNKALEVGSTDDLQTMINTTKVQIEVQKKFNEYTGFFDTIIKESNELLRNYSKFTDDFALSNDKAAFQTKIKELIPKSNEIVSKIDDAANAVDEELTPMHQELISLVNKQHNAFLVSLTYEDNTSVQSMKTEYLAIKKAQTDLSLKLKNHASSKGIKFELSPAPTT